MIKKKIVILGGGYGGIAAAKRLQKKIGRSEAVEIQLIEKNSYHTLMTQLHETAGGRTRSEATRIPYDRIFKDSKHVEMHVFHDTVENIDFENKTIKAAKGDYSFDYLAIATGSRPEFFGVEGAEQCAFKLWSFKEATIIREHIVDSFTMAAKAVTWDERSRLLTFAVAGGGFTGVEMIGELAHFTKGLCKAYDFKKEDINLYLIEAAPSILNTLPEKSVNTAVKYLEKMGVTIICNAGIEKVSFDKIHLNNGMVVQGSLIWSAGIKGNPYLLGSGVSTDHRMRIETTGYLQAAEYENVYCIGDAISFVHKDRTLPQVVENALQSGELAADNIHANLNGKPEKEYIPKFHGSMLSIGPMYGVAKVGRVNVKWLFATALKHLVNLHYHWLIGGFPLSIQYLKWQFLDKVDHILFSQGEGLEKQATQFF